MKNIKWILLGILIILIIITIYMYFDFIKVKTDVPVDIDNTNYIYNKKWYKIGVRTYKGEELIDNNFDLKNNKYMLFDKENVNYCDDTNNMCEEYEYSYNDGVIYMPMDFLVIKGNYNVSFNEDIMELSMISGDYMFIYYFETF